MKEHMRKWFAASMVCTVVLAACGGGGANQAATIAPATVTGASKQPAVNSTNTPAAKDVAPTQTPDNTVATAAPKADNTSFASAALLGKDPVKLTVKDSQFYYKLAFGKGAVVVAILTVDAGSPEPATLTMYDESQTFLKEMQTPVGKSGTLRYVFSCAGGTGAFLKISGNSSVTLSALSTPQNDGGTGGDAGQDFDTATAVKPGTLNGILGDADGNDYFVVDLPKTGGVLNVTVQTSDNVVATVYDNSRNFIAEVAAQKTDKAPAGLQHILATDQGGQWIVRLNGSGEYTATVAFGGQNDANSGKDAGDSFDAATSVKPGSYNGLLGGADGNDYYLIDLPKGGGSLSVTVKTTDGNVGVTLYDDSQNYIGEAKSDKNKPDTGVYAAILNGGQGGNWFVRVNGEGSYAFTVNFVPQNDGGSGKDAGDDLDTALSLDKTEFDGIVGSLDGSDYYKIPAANGRKVTVAFSGKGVVVVSLYDANRNFLKETSIDAGKSADVVDDTGAEGDYTIRMNGTDGVGAYHAKITK